MTLLLGSMLVLIAMGIPVAFAIAVSGVTYLTLFESVPIAAIAQRMVVGVDSFTLLAIPLFLWRARALPVLGQEQALA